MTAPRSDAEGVALTCDVPVVLTPAELMTSFDPAASQAAYHDLAPASPYTAPTYINYGVRAAIRLPLSFTPA
jgi:hypothetical protein